MLTSSDILRQIESTGVIAIIRASSSEELIDVVNALCEGGVTCIEVTMTTPNALEVIRNARRVVGDSAAIGVGTVLDSETARSAFLAGARSGQDFDHEAARGIYNLDRRGNRDA